ncbi:MAG: glycosyltransferase family 2 protein [Gaiellaceae bacterium]
MTEPEVSVVIPTRNRWPMLSTHALPSALAQEDVELEIVVVDDASDDGTADRVEAVGDPRVRVVRNEANRRLPASRNVGAAAARGAWLAFLDDDDLWAPRKLRAQLDVANATGAAWVYAQCIVVDGEGRPLDIHPFPDPDELGALLLGGNHVPGGGSNVIVHAEAFHEIGGFDEGLRFFEDWDLWLRLVQATPPATCPELLVARVEHGGNMLFRDRADVRADFERVLAKQGPVTDEQRLAVAEWMAHEHMRAGLDLRASALYARAAFAHRSPGNAIAAAGALFGRRGLALASRVLVRTRGATHLDEAAAPVPPAAPEWLVRYRLAR